MKINSKNILFLSTLFVLLITSIYSPQTGARQSRSEKNISVTSSNPVSMWNRSIGRSVSTPAITDLDQDNKNEIIVANRNNEVQALNSEDGSLIWSFSGEPGERITTSPVLGDFNNDGVQDVAIASQDHNLYALDGRTGNKLFNYSADSSTSIGVSVADLNQNGNDEILFVSFDKFLRVIENGKLLWRFNSSKPLYNKPTVADFDKDGLLEIILNTGNKLIQAIDTDGSLMWNYSSNKYVLRAIASSSFVDLDQDGNLEIIAIGADEILALHAENGTLIWETSFLGYSFISDTAIADIDSDGKIEIVFGTIYSNTTYAFNHDGSLLWSNSLDSDILSSATIFDYGNDNDLELLINTLDGYTYLLEGNNGSIIWKYQVTSKAKTDLAHLNGTVSSPVLANFDNDKDLELVIIDGVELIQLYDIGTTADHVIWMGYSGASDYKRHHNYREIDADSDTLLEDREVELGTDPTNPDTDGDGVPDGVEVKVKGTDPLNPTDGNSDSGDDTSDGNSSDDTTNTTSEEITNTPTDTDSLSILSFSGSILTVATMTVLIRYWVKMKGSKTAKS